MKIRFEELHHKIQIKNTIQMILDNPELKMKQKDALLFANILERLSSRKLEDEWKKDMVELLASMLHQVLEHRSVNNDEFMQTLDPEQKRVYAAQNNVYLIVLDNLLVKLGHKQIRSI